VTDSAQNLDNTQDPARELRISLLGRCMKSDKSEFPCKTRDISGIGVTVISSVKPNLEEKVIAYIDEVGRVEGIVTQILSEGFYLHFKHSDTRRDKIAETLNWIINRQLEGRREDRQHPRYIPKDSKSRFTAPDGETYPCEVLDMSISGASVAVKLFPKPILGAEVYLGKMRGRIVRQHNRGVAIQFADVRETSTLADRFA